MKKTSQEKKISEYMLFEMEEKQIKLEFEFNEVKEKLTKANKELGEKEKKIEFL